MQKSPAEAGLLNAKGDTQSNLSNHRSFFEEDTVALLRPLELCSPGVVREMAVDLAKPRVSLEWATPEVVVP